MWSDMTREKAKGEFHILSEAWHAFANLPSRQREGVVEDICINGDGFEFVIEWHDLGKEPPVMRVCIFEDAFRAFTKIPEFWKALSDMAGKNPQPGAIVTLLKLHGFEDKTERERPRGRRSRHRPATE